MSAQNQHVYIDGLNNRSLCSVEYLFICFIHRLSGFLDIVACRLLVLALAINQTELYETGQFCVCYFEVLDRKYTKIVDLTI